ncbi:enoyl-CoA hydratase/isomerase family protein [Sphaerisporangium viridialbum]|uniref:enoyl-CoA hydratase/isomerase family protein n=1 Tax=Sphaerisporangium viridialbum TaxID=46189 RepID=UPI003C764A2D
MSAQPLLVDADDTSVVVSLNRAAVRNALDLAMVEALHTVCARLEKHPQILVIRGEGTDFAAGADIRELRRRGRDEALDGINATLFERIRRLAMPTIALLDGNVLGGGAELAYACDLRIGTPRVRIGNPEPGLGIVAAAGGCVRLAELVGESIAVQVLLGGRILSGAEAYGYGLLADLVEPDELDAAADRLVERLARQAPLALRLTKALIHAPRSAHPLVANLAQAVLFETEEKNVRMDAYLDRRTVRP